MDSINIYKEARKRVSRENIGIIADADIIIFLEKENYRLAQELYYYKREARFFLNVIFKHTKLKRSIRKYYKNVLDDLNTWFTNQKTIEPSNYYERVKYNRHEKKF